MWISKISSLYTYIKINHLISRFEMVPNIKNIILYFGILNPLWFFSQIGGQNSFPILNYPTSARTEGLGGYAITVRDGDATLGQENPALLNREMHGMVNLNYINYFADANFAFTSYTRHFSNIGTFNANLLYADYGKFEYADMNGVRTGGRFFANDLAISFGYARPLSEKWSVGSQVRFLGSFYESYNAFGISFDAGVNYYDTTNGLGFSFLAKNMGSQLKGFTDDIKVPLPLNLIVGVSKKLEHAPFRFSLTYDNIQRFNLIYFDDSQTSTTDPLTGEIMEIKPPSIVKKFMYHITFGTEILLSETLHIRIGYNHMQRQTLRVGAKPGMTGFSMGFGFKVKKLYLSYAFTKFHIAGTSNQITISKRFGKVPDSDVDSFYRQH